MVPVTLIGIGQSFRGDDAAGILAVQQWQNTQPGLAGHPDLRIEIAETPGIGLLGLIAGSQSAILVDAVRSGNPPGMMHILTEKDISSFYEGAGLGHGWGVAETLELGHTLGREDLPQTIHIIGIEGAQFELGCDLSQEVNTLLPSVLQEITKLIRQHLDM